MPKFIGLHSLPGFTQEMLEMGKMPLEGTKCKVIRLQATEEGRVICEVEAETREDFIDWLNKINFPYDEVIKVDFTTEEQAVEPEVKNASYGPLANSFCSPHAASR